MELIKQEIFEHFMDEIKKETDEHYRLVDSSKLGERNDAHLRFVISLRLTHLEKMVHIHKEFLNQFERLVQ